MWPTSTQGLPKITEGSSTFCYEMSQINVIVYIGVSTPPPPLFFTKPLNLQAPFLGISPLYIGFLWPPPLLNIGFLLKIGLFSEPQKFKVLLFPPVTSINVKITLKTCWLLLLTLLPHWCKLSRPYLVPVPNYWTWIKANTEKSVFSGQILIKLRLWSLIS